MNKPTVGIITAPNFMSQPINPAAAALVSGSALRIFASRTVVAMGCLGETIMQISSLPNPDWFNVCTTC
jgi:hypothetical protein